MSKKVYTVVIELIMSKTMLIIILSVFKKTYNVKPKNC